ncbi:MAG: histidine kinase, partial [Actinomycetota bacterium]|nr:histidine kinase [Actinomycetota bacterium]
MTVGLGLRTKLTLLAVLALLGGIGTALFISFSNADIARPAIEIIIQVGAGWAWVGTGIFAWWRRPDNSFGRWMSATGLVWLAQSLVYSNSSLLFTVGVCLINVFILVLIQTVLRFPTGRIEAPLERRIAHMVTAVIGLVFIGTLFAQPSDVSPNGTPDNLLLVVDSPTTLTVLLIIANTAAVGLALLLIQSFVNKYGQAGPPGRRLLGPVLWTSTAMLGFIGLGSLFSIAGLEGPERITGVLTSLSVIAVPVAFLVGLFRSRLVRGEALGRMLERIAGETDPVVMRSAMADALGDPSIELAFWLPGESRYVSAAGEPMALPEEGSGRAIAEVTADGREVAAIIHDADLLAEPEKIDAVSRGAALALENVRLEAEVRAKVAEVRASRARIVEATDAARRELERNLHDGAQQNLVSLALKLQMARARIGSEPEEAAGIMAEASAELEATLAELRELARGIHPAILTDRGLAPALLALSHRAPLPVEVAAVPENRLPHSVEAAAYYVVAESLTNVARYAEASRAEVEIVWTNGIVRIRIADDGVGGAAPGEGSGLNGLSDRIAALDGQLFVTSPQNGGTLVEAVIPCFSAGSAGDGRPDST